ncbi:MAG: DUF4190 domain-containing protein [Phycisphaerae bacterium]|nr:DUF4190 domain-containing protein [Phycisphaerae bacterium]
MAAIVVGAMARQKIERSNGQLGGKPLAVIGMTLGIISSVIWTFTCLGAG